MLTSFCPFYFLSLFLSCFLIVSVSLFLFYDISLILSHSYFYSFSFSLLLILTVSTSYFLAKYFFSLSWSFLIYLVSFFHCLFGLHSQSFCISITLTFSFFHSHSLANLFRFQPLKSHLPVTFLFSVFHQFSVRLTSFVLTFLGRIFNQTFYAHFFLLILFLFIPTLISFYCSSAPE